MYNVQEKMINDFMNILQEIIKYKKQEVAVLKIVFAQAGRNFRNIQKRDFAFSKKLFQEKSIPHVIAEIKPASPSQGKIFRTGDTVEKIALIYTEFGASSLSVVTDTKFFGASMDNLVEARKTTRLPLLLKDFVIDELQIYDACDNGADAVLLMRSVLSSLQIQEFLDLLKTLGMDGLVEVHDETELYDVLENTTATIIGINNRDLSTMEIDLKNFETLLQNIPKELMVNRIFICESGLETRSDIRLYAKHANAVLVGTGILLAADREQKLIDITAKPQVKICGITNQKDALLCSQNASYLGFVFVMESLRSITVKKAKEIIQKVRDEYFSAAPRMVGVFVNADSDELKKYDFLDVFQFHGEESPDFCERMQKQFPEKKIWKAIKIRQEKDLEELKKYTCCDAVLIDAFSKEARGGTGKQIPVTILEKISEYITTGQKFFVAGGVSSENITDIVRGCFPDGVDLVSSLEKEKGIKDTRKLEYFFSEIKKL